MALTGLPRTDFFHRPADKWRPASEQIPKRNSTSRCRSAYQRHLSDAGELLWTGKRGVPMKARMGLLRARLGLRTHHFRHSIINQLYPKRAACIGFEHDVRWLDVAMHDTACFGGGKSACGLLDYIQGDASGIGPSRRTRASSVSPSTNSMA